MADRIFVEAVTAACRRRGIAVETDSDGWLIEMRDGSERRLAFGYDIGLNGAVAHRIASDKAATSALLARAGIPAVPHELFMDPDLTGRSRAAVETDLREMLQRHPGGLVLKPNDGNSGRLVIKVGDAGQIAAAMRDIFGRHLALAASPFVAIDEEIRTIVLDDRVLLAYRKARRQVTGDGARTLRDLVASAVAPGERAALMAQLARDIGDGSLDAVLPAGQTQPLTFRHNLDAGATPVLIESSEAREACARLALAAARAIDIRFASIDIVTVGGERRVLEINSGVVMETLAAHHPALVQAAYDAAVAALFARGKAL